MFSAQGDDPDRLPEGFRAEYEAVETGQARWAVVSRHFDVEAVASDEDIRADTLYYVRGKTGRLVRTAEKESPADPVGMTAVPSGRRVKPVARRELLELGRKGRLLRLVLKGPAEDVLQPASATSDLEPAVESSESPAAPARRHVDAVIDTGLFTQLLSAARQSGILSTADQIAYVRDRDFRMGKYRTAFDTIERLSVKFNQAAAQRKQKLRAEETKYRAGTLKMSPKQWQLKKQRDTLQTQIVERARRNFARVLDGLRILTLSR